MKVLFNDETKVLYESLFKEAMAVLNEGKADTDEGYVVIEDLPSYYQVLDQLKDLGLARFARVPVTEESFYIDADSRKITVPSAFDANGIAVQFDHTAETLYFTIDRYFDDFDLTVCNPANQQEGAYYGRCMIQWKNAAGDIGYDKAYMFDEGSDVATDDNYNMITFGWPLHEEITNVSGKLEFSVIFEVIENENEPNSKILYSFNTLPATCMIQPNLVPDENHYKGVAPEDVSALMSSALRPSFSGVFNSALGQKAYFLPDGDLPVTLDLVDGSYVLEVKADGSGELLYKWYKDGLQIEGADQATYTATIAGRYYVMVGNQNKDRVRWTQSQVCHIPEASELYYSVDLGPKGYANGTEVTVQVGGLNEDKKPLESVVGTVSFQWYKRDAQGVVTSIEGATGASYILNETDGPGHYYVVAKAFNNNDYSEDTKSSEMEVKLVAHSPSSVLLEWNEDSKKFIATPAIDYPTDLVYEWLHLDSLTKVVTRDVNEYAPTAAGSYQCIVYQNPWYDDPVWGTESDPPTSSNVVSITL